jgi:hypothetical protein
VVDSTCIKMGEDARRLRDEATLRAGGVVSDAPNLLPCSYGLWVGGLPWYVESRIDREIWHFIESSSTFRSASTRRRMFFAVKSNWKNGGRLDFEAIWEKYAELTARWQSRWSFRPWEHPECYQRERGSVREVEAPKCARCLICKALIKRRSLCGWIPGRARDYVHLSCYDRFPGGWSPPEVKRRASGRKRIAEERKKVLGYFERPPKLERVKRSEV